MEADFQCTHVFVRITEQTRLSGVWDRTITEIDTFNKGKTSPSSLSHFLWITKQKMRLYSAFKEVLNIFLLNQSIKGVIQFNSNVPNQFLNSWPDFLVSFCQENDCDLLNTDSCSWHCGSTVPLYWKRHALLLYGPSNTYDQHKFYSWLRDPSWIRTVFRIGNSSLIRSYLHFFISAQRLKTFFGMKFCSEQYLDIDPETWLQFSPVSDMMLLWFDMHYHKTSRQKHRGGWSWFENSQCCIHT